jgi:hypothetical protein
MRRRLIRQAGSGRSSGVAATWSLTITELV